ncbi:cyclin-dependent kinases regulatory subunit [Striga asiatica]|uniref:Cyclin-dependent kinases regulatory subunit n=1 Tax=Striga asiatica TaxID=4170 RepID=A0A5A7QU21_STRAF|nr:cyclin-dependent kinases regulatory subunit [Striga asiatica]
MGQIQYSEKYFDDIYEYRHVVLPAEVAKLLPKNRLLSEVSFGWHLIHINVDLGLERMACNWGPTKPRLGSLCHSPSGATHHALQEAAQLPTAAGQSSSPKHAHQVKILPVSGFQ